MTITDPFVTQDYTFCVFIYFFPVGNKAQLGTISIKSDTFILTRYIRNSIVASNVFLIGSHWAYLNVGLGTPC